MKVLTNSRTRFIFGADEQDLKRKYAEFLEELEAIRDIDFYIEQEQPALIITYTAGNPIYRDESMVGPDLNQPVNSPLNQQWLTEAVADIVRRGT